MRKRVGVSGRPKTSQDQRIGKCFSETQPLTECLTPHRGMQLSSGERKKDSSPAPPPPQPAEPTPSPVASSTPSKTGGGGKVREGGEGGRD